MASPLVVLGGEKDMFFLDPFATRQWDDMDYSGTRLTVDKRKFLEEVNGAFARGSPLVDGYAPFCKHIFVPNTDGVPAGAIAITAENR